MKRGSRRSARCLGALLGTILLSCGPKPVAVLTGLEIVVAGGDEQFGTVGQTLGIPLRAVVRMELTQEPQEDVAVSWVIESGGATLLTGATSTTDETGSVEASIRLGSVPADVSVRARVVNQPSASTVFSLHTVDPPLVTSVSPPAAMAGDTITVTGGNFSPVASQNVVLFSGMRGSVVDASASQLRVLVPTCLPARDVEVSVQLGAIASGTEPLTVTGGGVVTTMPVGEVLDVADDAGLACYALGGGAQYLALAYSASTVGAARHPFQLTALSSAGPLPPSAPVRLEAMRRSGRGAVSSDAQTRWDESLRIMEDTLVSRERSHVRAARSPAASTGPAGAVPTVGQRRTFSVWVGANDYESVSAVALYVGTESAIFVDENAPAGGFTASELAAFAQRFDEVIHPEVTRYFGNPSDLDGNARVIILFTPQVNGLTPRGASSFIGGFFFGNDLLLDNTGSNRGEVFYSLVPDPTGLYSDARPKSAVLNVVPAVLAHEFQHMVQFNQRYLELDAGQEALWLSEGLAQMAEELVARRYDELADAASAEMFRSGARARAVRYLTAPEDVSLIVSTGQGSLGERGAGFLHLLYLSDQEGPEVLGRLSTTTRRGVANVVAEVAREWPTILSDWWEATYRDGPGPESGTRVYPGLDLKDYLGSPFPLTPLPLGPGSATESGELWSSSVAYYLLSPDGAGSLSVRLGGEAGGASAGQAALRLRIVRIS